MCTGATQIHVKLTKVMLFNFSLKFDLTPLSDELTLSYVINEVVTMETIREVIIGECKFRITEDENEIFFEEISDRKNKVHFSMSKNKRDNEEAEYGLKVFWTEVFS